MFSERIREIVYWSLDCLKGSRVKKHLRDIKYQMENLSDSRVRKLGNENLTRLLSYAREKTEFYKGVTTDSLLDFPVINKNIIKENYQSFQSHEYGDDQTVMMHTSGSTGTPFAIRQNFNKRNRVLAEMMYFWGKAGYRIGMRYVYFRIWTDINRKSRLTAYARNLLMLDIKELGDERLEEIRKLLKKDKHIKMLLGYASTLENIAYYLEKCGDSAGMFGIKSIISISEVLAESTRERLKKIFNCSVASLYSNSENGMLAIECPENREFHLNTASYYFEFLKLESDEPAGYGEPARIVVTDLFNFAMPLIRYDTGDIAICKESCECAWNTSCVSSIQGRIVDFIFDTSGKKLSPHTVTNYMWPYTELRQFQFIQHDAKKYTLRLNGAKGHYDDSEFIELFTSFLGSDAEVTIEHVDEIPVVASGKFKKTICLYNKHNL